MNNENTKTVRVAAAQFAVGPDVEANLATTLRMIDQAAAHNPDLLVLPEFSNHCSWYEDAEHCYAVSVPLDGDFIGAVAERASAHGFYVVVNCSVARPDGTCTGTSVLIDPSGSVVSTADKQVLIGHENDFLKRATSPSPVVDTLESS